MIANEIGAGLWLFVLLRFIEGALFLTMSILWFRSMQRSMSACNTVSRSAEPETVWLTLIPAFGLVWQFVCVIRVSDSLAREYHRRGWHSDEDRPGRELGIVACVVITLAVLIRIFFAFHPGLGFLLTLSMCFTVWLHTQRLNSFCERLEKEIDPSTAFGQIPLMQNVYAPAYNSQQVDIMTQQVISEQLKSAYANIPFVPQTSFVPQEIKKDILEKRGIDEEMKSTTNIPNENDQKNTKTDSINRWAPPPANP